MIKKEQKIIPILDHILATSMNFGEQYTKSGIVIRSDNGKSEGVKPRWARVYAIGPDQTAVAVGEWILVDHGRWSRGFDVEISEDAKIEVFRIDPNGILMVADDKPSDLELGQYTSV